mmetsp:Transcript_25410/g.61209  ORF Transcript_25410/g.61209 Transcript_25410/m.61209 type:complete len:231 (+) Transcript_25410:1029-1721(+)
MALSDLSMSCWVFASSFCSLDSTGFCWEAWEEDSSFLLTGRLRLGIFRLGIFCFGILFKVGASELVLPLALDFPCSIALVGSTVFLILFLISLVVGEPALLVCDDFPKLFPFPLKSDFLFLWFWPSPTNSFKILNARFSCPIFDRECGSCSSGSGFGSFVGRSMAASTWLSFFTSDFFESPFRIWFVFGSSFRWRLLSIVFILTALLGLVTLLSVFPLLLNDIAIDLTQS